MNVAEYIADTEPIFRGTHFRHGFDRFHPTGRVRWHINGLLMIFLDGVNGLT